ncbi:MAG: aromatic ring-hydroxylating dioxygenase subunit alpha [Alphaproteobacteria bacterium]|nr:aromatic ring-hydroxylating dioxygenase subunit alpha [Alphaproteobacteria bacterium]
MMREQGKETGSFLRDFWYIGAWASEVTRKPMRRVIMNEPILFYQCEDGGVVALEDRCPHRNYPLSRGELIGDTIQCGYHGLTFGPGGQCVYAPGQDRAPAAAKLRSYPVIARGGIIWIYMGNPAEAANQSVPDLDWMTDPAWTSWIDGYIYLRCQHQFLTENLLDISHLAYVHKSSMGSDPDRIAASETTVTPLATGVRRRVRIADVPTPSIFSASALVNDRIDQWTESSMIPGLYQNHTHIKPASEISWEDIGEAPLQNRSFHAIIPETDTTTHYFHGGARLNVDVETITGERAHKILEEDVGVLEAIQQNEEFVGDRPLVNLRNDGTVMQWRAVLRGLQSSKAA